MLGSARRRASRPACVSSHRRCAIPLFPSSILLAAALASAPAVRATSGNEASVGSVVPDFAFPEFLVNGDGRQRLSEFHGQPLLIVNWTDTDFGRGASDKVRKLAKEFVPQGLVLILRESHNMTADDIRASAMRRYPGSLARFTCNMKGPVKYEENGPPPQIALIDAEGKLLLAGSYTIDLSRAEKLLPGEFKKLKTGWGTHEAARDARALLYGKGRLAEALACCDKALSSEPNQAELLEVKGEAQARFDSTLKQARHHLDKGECERARAMSRALVDSVAGRPELEEPAAKLLVELGTPEIQRELEFEKTLVAALKPLEKEEPSAKDVEKLERLAKEAGDTRVGRRAKELARVAALSIR